MSDADVYVVEPLRLPTPTKTPPTSTVVSLVGDFEDISLRESMTDSPSLSSTNCFSDISSSESSRNSSLSVTSDDLDKPSTHAVSATPDSPIAVSQMPKLAGYMRGSLKSKSVHALGSTAAPLNRNSRSAMSSSAISSLNHASLNHASVSSITRVPRHHHSPSIASTASTASIQQPTAPTLTDDVDLVTKRLARQRSIGSSHRPQRRDGPFPPIRRASTGTSLPHGNAQPAGAHGVARGASLQGKPVRRPAGPDPLLRRAISSNQLSRGLGIYPELDTAIAAPFKPRRPTKRLTSDELESHYDDADDGDDELPDATSWMWNVPMSPALYAKSRTQASPAPSPEIPQTPVTNHRSKRPSIHNSPDIATLPSIKEFEAVSATVGLEHLDDDAKDLTVAFNALPAAHEFDRRVSTGSTSASSSRRPSLVSMSSQRPSPQRSLSDVSTITAMTDDDSFTMSPSSKTRPAHLPRKSESEERKHREQHAKLLEKAASAEKKRESKRLSDLKAREKQQEKDEAEWKRVLPTLDESIKRSTTRELWWRGVPSKYREQIWKHQIGNSLQLEASRYHELVSEAASSLSSDMMAQISTSAAQTFPDLQIFGTSGPLHDDLVNILVAYAIYNPAVGYQQGLNTIAGMLLLNMAAPDAFVCLANMLRGTLTLALLSGDERTATTYYTSFLKVLKTKLPSLYQHFHRLRLGPSTYAAPMLRAQFTHHLSVDVAHRVWDIYMFEGDAFLLRVALGVLSSVEHRLYGTSAEIDCELGWDHGVLDVGNDDVFIKTVRDSLKSLPL